MRQEISVHSQTLRVDVGTSLRSLDESLRQQVTGLTSSSTHLLAELRQSTENRLDNLGAEANQSSELLRSGMIDSLKASTDSLLQQIVASGMPDEQRLDQLRQGLALRFENFSAETSQKIELLRGSIGDSGSTLQNQISQDLERLRNSLSQAAQQSREETAGALKGLSDTVTKSILDLTGVQKAHLDDIRTTVDNRLTSMSIDNEKRLEQMRQTVDEKLQGTLETRLGESFKQVSDRLDQVHKGLGEMQVLASGVGDLKRVLTNVKTRGTWGEVQLGTLLEQMLAPDQFEKNVSTTGTQERVEFAIKLPGREAGSHCWLPVDAKFSAGRLSAFGRGL